MSPLGDAERSRCPVCGAGLPTDPQVRRCPSCGARALWAQEPPTVAPGVALFNARLCGAMAGIQVGMIALLVAGYRLPIPWGVAAIIIALPMAGYALAGRVARHVPESRRAGLLVGVVALNAGLLVALIAAVLGLLDPVALAIITVGVGAVLSPIVRRAVCPGA